MLVTAGHHVLLHSRNLVKLPSAEAALAPVDPAATAAPKGMSDIEEYAQRKLALTIGPGALDTLVGRRAIDRRRQSGSLFGNI